MVDQQASMATAGETGAETNPVAENGSEVILLRAEAWAPLRHASRMGPASGRGGDHPGQNSPSKTCSTVHGHIRGNVAPASPFSATASSAASR